jgi:hypothetical protein
MIGDVHWQLAEFNVGALRKRSARATGGIRVAIDRASLSDCHALRPTWKRGIRLGRHPIVEWRKMGGAQLCHAF